MNQQGASVVAALLKCRRTRFAALVCAAVFDDDRQLHNLIKRVDSYDDTRAIDRIVDHIKREYGIQFANDAIQQNFVIKLAEALGDPIAIESA